MHLARLYPAPHEPNTPEALPGAIRHLRCLAAAAQRRANLEASHWTERLSWSLVADEYRAMSERWSDDYTRLESERAALLARGATLAEGSNPCLSKVRT